VKKNSIPGFDIIRTLGSGGMAIVYLAKDKKLGRKVAIKVLSDVLSENMGIRKRFFDEARMMSGLNHSNIVVLYDFIEFDNRLAIVMEYIDGKGLDRMIGEDVGPYVFEKALPIFKPILDATGYAHEKGIIHRDLKPSNILVSSRDIAKLTDFGIAKITGEEGRTRTGTKMGTLCYMSPEQILDTGVDHRVDIYALGVTLYEMLAGRMPLNDLTTDLSIMNSIVKEDFPDPRDFYPSIPAWLVKVVYKAINKDLDKRFKTCEEFMVALDKGMSKKTSILVEKKPEVIINEKVVAPIPKKTTVIKHPPSPKPEKNLSGLLKKIIPAIILVTLGIVFLPRLLNNGSEEPLASVQEVVTIPELAIYDSIPCGPYFQNIDQVACLSNGNFAVWDLGRCEISIFNSSGDFTSSIEIDLADQDIAHQPLASISDGGFAISGGTSNQRGGITLYNSDLTTLGTVNKFGSYPPLLITGNGSGIIAGSDLKLENLGDEIGYRIVCWLKGDDDEFSAQNQPVHSYVSELPSRDEWLSFVGRIPLVAVSADGRVYTTMQMSGTQTIFGYDVASQTLFMQLEVTNPVYPKPQEDIQQEIELISRLTSVNDFEPDTLIPAISSLGVDEQGRVWLQQGVPDSLIFDIYSPEGEKLLTVSPDLPTGVDWKVSVQPFGIVAYSEDIQDMQKVYMLNLTGYPPSDNSTEQEIE